MIVQQSFYIGLGCIVAGVAIALFPSNYEIVGMEDLGDEVARQMPRRGVIHASNSDSRKIPWQSIENRRRWKAVAYHRWRRVVISTIYRGVDWSDLVGVSNGKQSRISGGSY